MKMKPTYSQIKAARESIAPHVRQTPLEHSAILSKMTGAEVYLKLENYQLSGSFKIRGALSKLLSLSKAEKKAGIVTASSGNHGYAVAMGLKLLGIDGTIYLPENVSSPKLELIKSQGVEVVLHGNDTLDAEILARKEGESNSQVYISPYNDPQVIIGQGTIGLEIKEQLPDVQSVFIPIGGGGLASGIALALEKESCEIIGCQPANSAVMFHSVEKGHIITEDFVETISDGTAGGIEEGAITFPICKELIDEYVLVEEEEIFEAVKILIEKHFMWVEGAAGLSVASLIKHQDKYRGKKVVLIICGNKLKTSTFQNLLNP